MSLAKVILIFLCMCKVPVRRYYQMNTQPHIRTRTTLPVKVCKAIATNGARLIRKDFLCLIRFTFVSSFMCHIQLKEGLKTFERFESDLFNSKTLHGARMKLRFWPLSMVTVQTLRCVRYDVLLHFQCQI